MALSADEAGGGAEKIKDTAVTSNPQEIQSENSDLDVVEPAKSTALNPQHEATPRIAEGNLAKKYLSGWRLYILIFGLCLSLLLSTLETTIVATSLISITNALSGFENRDWIVTSYLLTYTGFLVIYAKFSDVFGVKFMILGALVGFVAFSVACGAATGMTELIVLRAFQGVGGSGIYSLVSVVAVKVIPPNKFGKYMAIISSVFAVSSILGPLLGGVINDHGSWRWVFLLNAPAGAPALVILTFFLPSDYQHSTTMVSISLAQRFRARFTRAAFARLDLVGAVLMLAASILLVFALEEAGARWRWGSGVIVGSLVVSGLCWGLFVWWEVWLAGDGSGGEGSESRGVGQEVVEGEVMNVATASETAVVRKEVVDKEMTDVTTSSNAAVRGQTWGRGVMEPIFPMRLLKNRVLVGMLLNAFFCGFPFTTLVVNIPQRFQAVNGSSPTQAGITLLPLLLMTPFASGVSALLVSGKYRVPPLYLITLGSILQLLGVALETTLSSSSLHIQKVQYAYEVLMGIGFGLVLSSLLTMLPLVVHERDLPVVIGALTQVRVLGGTIGLAIGSVVLSSFLGHTLSGQLSGEEIRGIEESLGRIGALDIAKQGFVRSTFAEGYRRQTLVLVGFCGLVLASCLLMWERVPRRHVLGKINGEEQLEEG